MQGLINSMVIFSGEPNCLDRGTCLRVNHGSVCRCNAGFDGTDCSIKVCAGEPMCSDHGKKIFTFLYPAT